MGNTNWDSSTRRTVAIILGVLFIYLIYIARPVLPFLIISALIAYIVAPVISFLRERLRFPKGIAIATAYLLFVIAVLLTPILFVPALISAFADISFDPVPIIKQTRDWLLVTLNTYRHLYFFGVSADLSPIVDPAEEYLKDLNASQFIPTFEAVIAYIPSTIQITWDVASRLFGRISSIMLAILITFLYSIYMSASAGEMRRSLSRFVPPAYRPELITLGVRVQRVWRAYLRGQFTLAIIIWLLTWFIGTLIGLPGAFALGVIAGAMEIIPNLGPLLAAIPALLAALLQGSTVLPVSNGTFFLIVLGVYILIQQIENNIIVPKVLGDAVELPPLAVMVGVIVGFSVGGILGAVIAAPVVATGREIVGYAYAKVVLLDPFPPEEKPTSSQISLAVRIQTLAGKLLQTLAGLKQKRILDREKSGQLSSSDTKSGSSQKI
jgi:predicted PurR-regulated permease PerM